MGIPWRFTFYQSNLKQQTCGINLLYAFFCTFGEIVIRMLFKFPTKIVSILVLYQGLLFEVLRYIKINQCFTAQF